MNGASQPAEAPATEELFVRLAEALESGDPLPEAELTAHLRHPEGSIRRLAIELLEFNAGAVCVPALLDAAADADPEVGIAAAELLRSLRDPAAPPLLVEGVRRHPATAARLAAIVALREHRAPEAIEALTGSLRDPDPAIRRDAVITLGHYQRADLAGVLGSAVRDESAAVRQVAVESLANFEAAQPDLRRALGDKDWQVRRSAAQALRRSPDARDALLDALADPAWQVAKEAALSLAALAGRGDERLVPLLSHELADVRIAAARALGKSAEPRWRDRLEPLLADPDTGVQKAARRALDHLSGNPESSQP